MIARLKPSSYFRKSIRVMDRDVACYGNNVARYGNNVARYGDSIPMLDAAVYRIRLHSDDHRVVVMYIGDDEFDSPLDGIYGSVDDLPMWIQKRLAVLMIMSAEPPTTEVKGVGRRISQNVFWVVAPDDISR